MSVVVWVAEGVKAYASATSWEHVDGYLSIYNGEDREIGEYAPGWRAVWFEEEPNASSSE